MLTTIRAVWILLALTPLCLLLGGLQAMSLVAGIPYVAGSILLYAAARRDPQAEKLRALARSLPGRVAPLAVLAALQIAGFLLSSSDLFILLTTCAAIVFALWTWCPTGPSLVSAAGRAMLVALALFVTVGAGELLTRLPQVVARTGGTSLARQRWADEHYDFLWRRNIYQLRSFHVEDPKPAGTARIVTLGDSLTWGDKIPRTEDTWPYVLERTLNARGDLPPVQVINLGKQGYTTVNEAEALERLGFGFEPDLVVLQFTVNDPLPSAPNFGAEPTTWFFRTVHLFPAQHQHLNAHSYLYAFLDSRFQRMQMALFYPEGHAPLYADDFAPWIATQQAIGKMADATRARGIPLLVLLHPHLPQLDAEGYGYAAVHEKIAAAVERARLPLLDLLPVLAERDPVGRHWWALPWDAHPGIDAHALAGETVAATLVERGLIGVRSSLHSLGDGPGIPSRSDGPNE